MKKVTPAMYVKQQKLIAKVLKAQAALDKAIEALEGFDDKNFPDSKGFRKVTYILPDLTTETCTVGDFLC